MKKKIKTHSSFHIGDLVKYNYADVQRTPARLRADKYGIVVNIKPRHNWLPAVCVFWTSGRTTVVEPEYIIKMV